MEVAANQTLLSASGTSMGSRPPGSRVWPQSLFLHSPSDRQLTAKTCLGRERANVIKRFIPEALVSGRFSKRFRPAVPAAVLAADNIRHSPVRPCHCKAPQSSFYFPLRIQGIIPPNKQSLSESQCLREGHVGLQAPGDGGGWGGKAGPGGHIQSGSRAPSWRLSLAWRAGIQLGVHQRGTSLKTV